MDLANIITFKIIETYQFNVQIIYLTKQILPNSHSLFDIRRRNRISQIDDKLGKLLHIDNVLWVVRIGVDDFRASGDLQGLFVLERLFVRRQIPQSGRRQPRVALLDAGEFIHLLDRFLDVVLDHLDALVVLSLTLRRRRQSEVKRWILIGNY